MSTAARQAEFEDWFGGWLGRNLLAAELRSVQGCVEALRGIRLLELPVCHRWPMVNGGLIVQRIQAVSHWQPGLPSCSLVCEPEELPFESDSMDVVVLHHVLDFAAQPHQALREAARVLASGGHLVILGFNPLSFWGVRRLLGGARSAPWNGRFIPFRRLEDWLTLLDFRVTRTLHDFYRPPLSHPGWLQLLAFLERWGHRLKVPLGAYYVVVAQKRVAAPIRLRPRWRQLVNVGSMQPVGRVSRE